MLRSRGIFFCIFTGSEISLTINKAAIKDSKRIFGLDFMRAMAIMMVLIGHCAWIFPPSDGVIMQLLAMSGYLGVEIFFVLSGFLIGNILYKMFTSETFTIKSAGIFLKRRWFRTLPNYYLILLVNIAIASYIGYQIEDLWRYFFFLQNFASPMLPFFTESWSLSIEEFAYLLLPFALMLISNGRNRNANYITIILLLWLVFVGNKFLYHYNGQVADMEQWNLAVKSVVVFRLDAIFTGVICSWLYINFNASWNKMKYTLLLAGLFLMGFLVFGIGQLGLFIDSYPFFWNVIYLPLTSFTVACFLPFLSEWQTSTNALYRPVTFISKISYSMYLLHYGVVLQLMRFQYDVTNAGTSELLLFTLIYFMLTIGLSFFLYKHYERPMMNLRERKTPS